MLSGLPSPLKSAEKFGENEKKIEAKHCNSSRYTNKFTIAGGDRFKLKKKIYSKMKSIRHTIYECYNLRRRTPRRRAK